MPMAVADRDEDAECGSSWTEDADDGDGEDWELFPKLLAMYRWRELLRFGIGMLLRLFREGDVDSGEPWDTSIVIVDVQLRRRDRDIRVSSRAAGRASLEQTSAKNCCTHSSSRSVEAARVA